MELSRLSVLVYPEASHWWTARSLERDIAAAARTADAALDSAVKILQAHIVFDIRHGRKPLSAFAKAPRPYWTAFAGAARIDLDVVLQTGDGPPIRVTVARLAHHPVVCARIGSESGDPVVAPLERLPDLVLEPHDDRADTVVEVSFDDARRHRGAVARARV